MRLIPCQSSSIAALGMNPDNDGEVVVQFTNGKFYRYFGVPSEVVLGVLFSESQGAAFGRFIRDASYPFEIVEDTEALNLHV